LRKADKPFTAYKTPKTVLNLPLLGPVPDAPCGELLCEYVGQH
jgi:hypothetical protein